MKPTSPNLLASAISLPVSILLARSTEITSDGMSCYRPAVRAVMKHLRTATAASLILTQTVVSASARNLHPFGLAPVQEGTVKDSNACYQQYTTNDAIVCFDNSPGNPNWIVQRKTLQERVKEAMSHDGGGIGNLSMRELSTR